MTKAGYLVMMGLIEECKQVLYSLPEEKTCIDQRYDALFCLHLLELSLQKELTPAEDAVVSADE